MAHEVQMEIAMRLLEGPLEYPGLPKKKRPRILLRVWRYPAFEPHCSWTVIEDSKQHFVRRIVWDQRSGVISQEPETYGAEAPIEKSMLDGLLSKLQAIELSAFIPVNTIGIDGVINGVEVGNYMASARLIWWCEPPSQWSAVYRWHNEAIQILDRLLPSSTAHRGNAP